MCWDDSGGLCRVFPKLTEERCSDRERVVKDTRQGPSQTGTGAQNYTPTETSGTWYHVLGSHEGYDPRLA